MTQVGPARSRIRTVAVALLVLGMIQPVAEASAFPRPENNCSDDTITYYFDDNGSGGAWAGWEQAAAEAGFLDWLVVRDWDGGTVVDSLYEVAGPGGGAVKVELDTTPNNNSDTLGYAECFSGATISLNPTHLTTSAKMEHWSRHELGHLLGLEHTGDDDSFGGPLETMATCGSGATTSSLSQDDYGSIVHKQGDLDPEIIHANAGFEQSSSFWGFDNVAYWTVSTSNPEDGAAALHWRPASSSGAVYQTMNFAASGSKYIDARTNYRKLYSSSTVGYIYLEIWVRQVTYASNPSCSYPTGKNQNDRTYEGSWTSVRIEYATPSTSWNMLTEGTLYQIPASWDAADVRVYVRSTVRYTAGDMMTVGTDTTRARDRS